MTNALICNEENPVFCSLIPTTDEERAEVYNMAVNPARRLSEMINKRIKIKNIYVEMVDGVDNTTGETWSAPRVVLQDIDGETYSATSYGLFKACQRIVALWGPAPWNGIPVTVIQRENNGRRTYSLKVEK